MTLREINRRLGEYDSALRMIRARHDLSFYRIERKVQGRIEISQKPSEMSWTDWREVQDPDDVDSAREGYLLLFPVFSNQLDRRIFTTVVMSDLADTTPQRVEQGCVDRMKRAQAKAKDAFGDMVGYEAKQAYNYMNRVRTVSEKHCHTAPVGGMSIMGD